MHRWIGLLLTAGFAIGCAPSTDVAKERETLRGLDREWSASVKDMGKFMSFYAADASVYPQGMPIVTGAGPIHEAMMGMLSSPGFALEFAPTKAEVSAAGDVGYTTGTYQATMAGSTEKGKYVAVWKKQTDGQWKVAEDIFNADASGPPPSTHVMVAPASVTFADGPPSLPPGGKMAVLSGDPTKPGPFVLRAQVPAGYKVPPHWHPTDENLTVLSGTIALGMGDTWDEKAMQSLPAGGLGVLPANMRHSFLAKTAATFQVHGMGPFVVNYVNPADDPSQKK
jgi:ketosteroid isomerase-like protein